MFRFPVIALVLIWYLQISSINAPAAQNASECVTPDPSGLLSFSDTLATVTDPFNLDQGVYVISGVHQGSGNFAVWAYDEVGNRELLFNEIGLYQGETTLRIDAATRVILDVEADGPWEVDISPAF